MLADPLNVTGCRAFARASYPCRISRRSTPHRCWIWRRSARAGCLRSAGRQESPISGAGRGSLDRHRSATPQRLDRVRENARTLAAFGRPGVRRMPAGPSSGGTARRSIASCWTHPAPHQVSCVATPTSSGCAETEDIPALAAQQRRLLEAYGTPSLQVVNCSTRHARSFRRKTSCRSRHSCSLTRRRGCCRCPIPGGPGDREHQGPAPS